MCLKTNHVFVAASEVHSPEGLPGSGVVEKGTTHALS